MIGTIWLLATQSHHKGENWSFSWPKSPCQLQLLHASSCSNISRVRRALPQALRYLAKGLDTAHLPSNHKSLLAEALTFSYRHSHLKWELTPAASISPDLLMPLTYTCWTKEAKQINNSWITRHGALKRLALIYNNWRLFHLLPITVLTLAWGFGLQASESYTLYGKSSYHKCFYPAGIVWL